MVRTVLVFRLVADDGKTAGKISASCISSRSKQNQHVIFIKLRTTPEGDLMPPMEANLLIVTVRTVRSIVR